jgi:hypothetical protein
MQRTRWDVVGGGTFERNSTAIQHTGAGPVTAAIDGRRTRRVLSVSASDGVVRTAELPGGATHFAGPQCIAGGYLYARDEADVSKLYRSLDGDNWTAVAPTGLPGGATFGRLFATASGRLVAWIAVNAAYAVYYSDDGAAWTAADLVGGAWSGYPEAWNFHQAPHGTLVASTYNNSGTPLTGCTWTEATRTLTKAGGFPQYAALTGKRVAVTGGTGAAVGEYEIESATLNALVLKTSIGAGANGQSDIACDAGLNQIWRSADDGATWTLVQEFEAGYLTHIHAGAYHVATGQWIVNTGDNIGTTLMKHYDLISRDDGVTWEDWRTGLPVIDVSGCAWNEAAKTLTKAGAFDPEWEGLYAKVLGGTGLTAAGSYHLIATATADTLTLATSIGAGADGQSNIRLGMGTIAFTRQNTRFVEYGHPRKLLLATDGFNHVGYADLVSYECGTVLDIQESQVGDPFWFELFRFRGLWYATSYDNAPSGQRHAIIAVSPDLEHWAVYHRFTETTVSTARRYAGYLNGKLHFEAYDNDVRKHFVISPAQAALVDAVELHPAGVNALPADLARCEAATATWYAGDAAGAAFELDPAAEHRYAGASSYRAHGKLAPMAVCVLSTGLQTVTAGQAYVAMAVVRGRSKRAGIYITGGTEKVFALRDGEWTLIWAPAVTVAGTSVRIALRFEAFDPYRDDGLDVHIGALGLYQLPGAVGEWTPGAATQPADALSFAVTPGSDWTHVFTARLLPASLEMAGTGNPVQYLASYAADADDYAAVYFDPADGKWHLATVDGGGAPTAAATATARWLHRGALVRVAVRYAAGRLRLTVADGLAAEHTDAVAKAGTLLHGAEIAIRHADPAGANGISCWLGDSQWFDFALSDANLAALLARPSWNDGRAWRTGGALW